jgi:hypothetical protein
VRSEHLDDFLLGRKRPRQLRGGGEVSRLSLALGEGLVRNASDEILDEPVLTVFGGARIGLDR